MNQENKVNQSREHSGGAAESPRPALECCPTCTQNFTDAYAAMCENQRLVGELKLALAHGQVLSREVDRLRAMIETANKMGFEILEQINSQGSGVREH